MRSWDGESTEGTCKKSTIPKYVKFKATYRGNKIII